MGTKILLADDSITIQKVVGIIFASEDYELAIVGDGNAALTKAREAVPDVLLVDAVMPGMTGYEVCEEVRRDPSLKGVPILLLTGAFEPFDEEKARKCGADDFISKPFESQSLIDKVATLVDLGKRRAAAITAPPPAAPLPQASPPAVEKPVQHTPQPGSFVAPPAPPTISQAGIEKVSPVDAPQFTVEIVEGTSDDDLWGAFELEEVATDEFGEHAEIPSGSQDDSPLAAKLIEEPFAGADGARMAATPEEFTPKWEPVEEETFVFEEEPGAGLQTAQGEPFGVPGKEVVPEAFTSASEEPFGVFEEEPCNEEFEVIPEESFGVFEEDTKIFATAATGPEAFPAEVAEPALVEPPQIPTVSSGVELQFAPEEEYVPVLEPAMAAGAPVPSPLPAAGEPSLSEEQLAALVSRISRDILEKIAWEVVPDLAERIIREEIQKIKEG